MSVKLTRPNELPRGSMDALCVSRPTTHDTTACPASWYAVNRSLSSLKALLRVFSSPRWARTGALIVTPYSQLTPLVDVPLIFKPPKQIR